MRTWSAAVATFLPLVALACDAQVGDDFRGEPIAVVRGDIEAEGGDLPRSLGIALLWETEEGSDVMPGWVVPLEPILPASFEMVLYATPPAEVQNAQVVGDDESGAWSADATIAVVDLDALPDDPGRMADVAAAVLATADRTNEQFTIVWADRSFDSNGTPIAAGYQVGREYGVGTCPSDPEVVDCIERYLASGATQYEAEDACWYFTVEHEYIDLEDWRPRVVITADRSFIPPWGSFPYCLEGLCPGGT
ncbi:MAG TPA: hypothetical protein VNO33_13180, partial [Kofleriaceae bacterium]|nr:hypothetical protein [Kofleriaceae bacterium]